MATPAKKAVFDLLAEAPKDTAWDIVSFLRRKICDQVKTPLATIGDKALVRHLNALLHGPTTLTGQTSARAKKAAQGSTLKGEFMPWGIGDASRSNDWAKALAAVRRLAICMHWPLGKTLSYLMHCLRDETPSNRLLTAWVSWWLDNELAFVLQQHLSKRLVVTMASAEKSRFERRWQRAKWCGLEVSKERLLEEALRLNDGNHDKAAALVAAVW